MKKINKVVQGLLFIYMGKNPIPHTVQVPQMQELDEEEGWVCLDMFRDLPYGILFGLFFSFFVLISLFLEKI